LIRGQLHTMGGFWRYGAMLNAAVLYCG
jgi:hypothetical protein